MRYEGYSTCPVCVCVCVCVCLSVCLSVSPHAILEVRAITSKTKDTIVLSVEFGHFVLTCNLRAMFRILSVTRSLTCYACAILGGQRSSV